MDVTVANQQDLLPVDTERLAAAVAAVLSDGARRGAISVAVVDDPTIHRLNAQFLEHDYPTDVLSFALEEEGERLEGEIIVSAQTAMANAAHYGWPADHELLLYAIHGALHLAGYRDKTEEEAGAMRAAEAEQLRRWGIDLPTGPLEGANRK